MAKRGDRARWGWSLRPQPNISSNTVRRMRLVRDESGSHNGADVVVGDHNGGGAGGGVSR